ncbi:fibrous sheath CABYR-binding protein-like [Seriola lalandi dorsalis]|nr:fibrous sheath CABYR-binding protein-like [Seriola lalandi dorsalis]
MDLSIVKRKLESKSKEGECYRRPEEFVADIRLIFFNCAKYYKATSEVGSAGLYLEDYFEEQLKLVYPDKVFPGGREEQMIPPLEDEIEEEEEMMEEGLAPIEHDKPQSPAGKGIPPVEEDLAPLEEAPAPAEEEKSEIEEKATDTSEKETEKTVSATGEGSPPAVEAKQDEKSPVKEVESSPAADSETKDGVAPSSPKEENLELPTDKTVDPPEIQEKEAAPADTAKEEEG